ncbi:MAG: hypothetical protein ETSY1_37925 [Candidatus Entotheonella factor]|uniref:Uncharacterized protein n=1 Tax=Entotheonella factor TaxID=1429438 RepID=W4L7S6_ENTF1|nr:MAG: hypothetical protein ETSY1_37925 [Candidatus Entotheonella factor]
MSHLPTHRFLDDRAIPYQEFDMGYLICRV